jgi:membrane protease YdiL (CAAX protease family)
MKNMMQDPYVKTAVAEMRSFIADNRREVIIFFTVLFVLIANKYLGQVVGLLGLLQLFGAENIRAHIIDTFELSQDARFNSLVYWGGILCFNYMVIPSLVIVFVLKEKLSEFGLQFKLDKGFFTYYLYFFLVALAVVYLASKTTAFQAKYPFLKIHSAAGLDAKFFIWECVYVSMFFCLEFFFRGFMVKGLKNKFGLWSIFIMTVPYCMIHFGKPLAETIGAIFAGLALGYISYHGRGILAGFFMHVTVALSMDGMALWQTGVLSR